MRSTEYRSMTKKILVIGAAGQIGTELTSALRKMWGNDNVVAADLKSGDSATAGPFEVLNVMDGQRLAEIIDHHQIDEVYHLAALLSATAEKRPREAWELNMTGLFNVLDLAKEKKIRKVFWPSSIAVFGPNSPKNLTPQHAITEPNTVYGISKVAGESWCEYYHKKYGVDIRSIRYPGLIGYNSAPGGGTTDYAVHIFYEALSKNQYTCFLSAERSLPMMYMPDAIRATIELMEAPADQIKIHSSYNLSGISFSPEEIARKIETVIPGFSIDYDPDFRDDIAAGWPASIDDTPARKDWGWKPDYDLESMIQDMFAHLPTPAEHSNS